MRWHRAFVLLVPLLACTSRKSDEKREDPERPVPEALDGTESWSVDRLIVAARKKVPAHRLVSSITIEYARPDGTIDPAYGTVEVRLIGRPRASRGPVDDPNRPTGAPAKPQPRPAQPACDIFTWRQRTWSSSRCTYAASYDKPFDVRCTVPIIWERAIGKGAPRDAVAKLTIRGTDGPPTWRFSIEDKIRGVRFHETFVDDCELVAEAPDPTVGPDTIPRDIDRTMIANTIGTVKAQVAACVDTHPARGTVKLAVQVAPDGTPTVSVRQSPNPELGACVKAIIERAKFPATSNGGSFSYPFVF